MSKDLRIESITKASLRKAIEDNTYWSSSIVPLPKSKALWLLSNPRIQEDDYCGVLGLENGIMVAFVYLIPDILQTESKKKIKIYWEILWWVSTKYQNTVLGTYIYNEALNLVNKKVVLKSYAENTTKFYEKQPFSVLESRLRHTIFFSLDKGILLGRFSFLKYFKRMVAVLDRMVGVVIRFVNMIKIKKRTVKLSYDYINQLDKEAWNFIAPLCEEDFIYKTREYVDWQIRGDQYTQTPIAKKFEYFPLQVGVSHNIAIYNLKIVKDEKIIGFLSFVINSNEFNVKYFLVGNNSDYGYCVDALC